MANSTFLQWTTLVGVVLGVATLVAGCQVTSCGPNPRRVEFSKLRGADRIDVIGGGGRVIETIIDQVRVQKAVTFIERHEDGWTDHWSGPRAPTVMLWFYRQNHYVGEFGLSTRYLTVGSGSRDAPSAEIQALAKELGLAWPLQDQK